MKRLVAYLSLFGCTDVGLYRAPGLGDGPIDNKLAIESRFCTEDPTRLNYPVKIMFVVDTSQSMIQTDPTGQRLIAVQQVVDAFISDPGVEFAIIQFSGAAAVLTNDPDDGTPGFTTDYMDLTTAIVRLGLAEQPTDYEGALSAAQLILARDMMKTSDEDLSRSKYVIIFLSDGLPNPVTPPANTRTAILDLVEDIAELKRIFRPAEVLLHTALLLGAVNTGSRCTDILREGGNPICMTAANSQQCDPNECEWIPVIDEATDLLTSMSTLGGGTFRSFPNGEEINFLKVDFTSIRRVFTLKNLLVTNTNARPRLLFVSPEDRIGRASPDSDGDGLDDAEERLYGTDNALLDTDADGFNDFLEVRLGASGFDPLDPTDADCTAGIDDFDGDGDGLLDCEERFVGTHKDFEDSDADGVPDVVEMRYGTNPAADDSRADLDFDAARNADEVRGHSDPVANDAADRSAIAYRYDVVERGLEDMEPTDPRVAALNAGRSCYDFRVDNVTLAGTADGGRNRIYIYVDQAPFDDPTDYGVFRIGCVEQIFIHPDFRDPPYPEVEIPTDDADGDGWPDAFKFPTEFDPDRDCTTGRPPPLEDD